MQKKKGSRADKREEVRTIQGELKVTIREALEKLRRKLVLKLQKKTLGSTECNGGHYWF